MKSKYNKLTIIKEVAPHKLPCGIVRPKFKCLCDCGNTTIVLRQHLVGGHTKSCGCLLTDVSTTHGLCYHPLYAVFSSIKRRCYNKKNQAYKNYGGRGIKCEWKSFEEFYKDMFPTYQKGLTIDRINNNGHYSKKNCKWVTMHQQSRNKRCNVKYKGETMADASIRLGGSHSLVEHRLKRGQTFKKAFSTPSRNVWK